MCSCAVVSGQDIKPRDATRGAAQTPSNNSTSGGETLIVVVGAAGAKEFDSEFNQWAAKWEELAKRQSWKLIRINDNASSTSERTPKQRLQDSVESAVDSKRLWIVLLGHGTFAKNLAKFNLAGPDVSATELKAWLKPIHAQTIVINCSSASAPFLTALADDNRIIVTATKSGSEYNYARFGKYLAESINEISNDIDHDKEVSLLEAFLAATSGTERFYREEARLSTEHALLNDNGDKVGTTGDFYRGVRPVKASSEGSIDGTLASRIILLTSPENASFPPELDEQRTKIEQQIDRLRGQKTLLQEDDYFGQLEKLLLELAALYDEAEEFGSG